MTPKPRVLVVAGMPRAGTTWLYHNLQKHPSFFLPFRKESNYFSTNHDKGLAWYANLFEGMRPDQIGADISPYYFLDDNAIPRALDYDPEIKVVLGVRDPASFALSLYAQHISAGYDVPLFPEYIDRYTNKVSGKDLPMRLRGGFLPRRIEEYRAAFGTRLLLYDFDRFHQKSLKILQAIEAFAGVPSYFTESNYDAEVINAGNRKNSRFLTSLMTNETLVAAINLIFPRRAVQFARRQFDKASKPKGGENPQTHTEENKRLAREAFADDKAQLSRLFNGDLVRLGTGARP